MTTKVGPKGQVVIPKQIRDRLGLGPGDRVTVEQAGDAVLVAKALTARGLRGSLPPSRQDPLAVLLEERRRDRQQEDRRT